MCIAICIHARCTYHNFVDGNTHNHGDLYKGTYACTTDGLFETFAHILKIIRKHQLAIAHLENLISRKCVAK